MQRTSRICLTLSAIAVLALALAGSATAGDYYVYGCTTYGNTAPAFAGARTAAHMNTADDCMQSAAGSLEINQILSGVAQGYGASWAATAPPGVAIVGAYTPVNDVIVDGDFSSDGFTGEYQWASGTQAINCVTSCGSGGLGYADGINTSFAPSSWFGWAAGCYLQSSCTSSAGAAVLGVHGIRLTAEENTGPISSRSAATTCGTQAGKWIRGGGWPVTFTAADPSGVCGTHMLDRRRCERV